MTYAYSIMQIATSETFYLANYYKLSSFCFYLQYKYFNIIDNITYKKRHIKNNIFTLLTYMLEND